MHPVQAAAASGKSGELGYLDNFRRFVARPTAVRPGPAALLPGYSPGTGPQRAQPPDFRGPAGSEPGPAESNWAGTSRTRAGQSSFR